MKNILLVIIALLSTSISIAGAGCGLANCQPYVQNDARGTDWAAQVSINCHYSPPESNLTSICTQGPPLDGNWRFSDIACAQSQSPDCVRECLECNATGGKCDRLIFGDGLPQFCSNNCDCPQPGFAPEYDMSIPELSNSFVILAVVLAGITGMMLIKKK